MSFTIDDSILANIKTQQDSEDDDDAGTSSDHRLAGETFMEVMGGFGGNISDANVSYEERIEDPLQEEEDEKEIELKEFPWQCIENDFLKPYLYDEQETPQLEVKVGRSKKAKLEAELRAPNGQVWSKVPLAPPIADDLPEFMAAGKGPAKSVTNPLEAWHLLIDVSMLNIIVKSTNEVIKATKKKEPHQKRLTDLTELRAWLGLNYLCGVLRNSIQPGPVEELWTLELGNAIFRATMSFKRFEFLSQCIRCADQQSLAAAPTALDEIANFWEKLVINCRSYYAPSGFCTIDEHILDLSQLEENPFNHVLPQQLGLIGLRLITMCDAKTMYICNALVANEVQPLDEEVYQLVSDIKGTRRCLCINDRFTNMSLMQKLKQNQLQVVGALSAEAKEIPVELYNAAQVPQVWYAKDDCTLVAGLSDTVIPSGCLVTNGLSTRIDSAKLYQTIGPTNQNAYQCMRVFGTHNGGVNKNQRWSLEYLFFMLDVAAYNSWTLYRLSENGDAGIEQRDFQRQLGLYLTQHQLKQRIHLNIKLPLPLKLQIAEILGENVEALLNGASKKATEAAKLGSISKEKALVPDGIVLQSRENDTRRRCRGCKSRNGSKTKTRCQQCLQPYCMRHLISRCETCSGYEILDESLQQDDTNEQTKRQQKDQADTSQLEDEEGQADEVDL
ncbi:uncharacterized protein LOC111677842 [Lucilia cuprina]|uniref:uncharacterized protein LOC111677842 n=1 Tax=Lucilia cuprina TaxID=7375 RepID=UPI001F06A92F|nr:uncharacterized protein LOC111677842 [Lucilia cuprina]